MRGIRLPPERAGLVLALAHIDMYIQRPVVDQCGDGPRPIGHGRVVSNDATMFVRGRLFQYRDRH